MEEVSKDFICVISKKGNFPKNKPNAITGHTRKSEGE